MLLHKNELTHVQCHLAAFRTSVAAVAGATGDTNAPQGLPGISHLSDSRSWDITLLKRRGEPAPVIFATW